MAEGDKNIIGIYHKDCVDGTTAAAVLLRKFPDITLFPLHHSYESPEVEPIVAAAGGSSDVYMVDCALGVEELLEEGNTITIIDNHIEVKDNLEALDSANDHVTFIFDEEKSEASLTWASLFPDEEKPEIIKFVEDSDLWQWELGEDTKYVNNYLSILVNNPQEILKLFDNAALEEVKIKGKAISDYVDFNVTKLTEGRKPLNIRVGPHEIPAYNVTTHVSSVGSNLSRDLDKAVGLYTITGEIVRLEFRSKEHHNPTSYELARQLGGGGHRDSAVAEVPISAFLEMIKK